MNPYDIPMYAMYAVCRRMLHVNVPLYHLDQDALEDCRFRSKNQTSFRNHNILHS